MTQNTENERTNRTEKPVHVHMYIDIKNKQGRFYIPQSLQETFKRLDKILHREEKTLSKWIQQNAIDYVRLHEPGNPQQRIDNIIKTGKPYHAKPLCSCGQQATRKATLDSGEVVFRCGNHFPKQGVVRWRELKTV